MKFKLPLATALLLISSILYAQVITTVSSESACTSATTVQVPVRVAAFTAVGSISLRLSYVSTELSAPTVVYKDPGLETWGTFSYSTNTPGTIIISAYDPDVTTPVSGLTLSDNTILFTLQFTIGTITNPAVISFSENTQGTWCEYGGPGPNYTPFIDTPTNQYYISGSVTVAPDPVAPSLTKVPADATVCAGETLTVTTTPGSGGAGTIADEYRYSTDNGTNWSAWSTSVPSFAAIGGTNVIQSRRTATATGCGESDYNEVSWTVNARQKISGVFHYYNSTLNILLTGQDITVNLYKSSDLSHSNLIATDVTDVTGYYEFPNLCPDCEYDIVATSTHSTEGAINTTDAAQANYWGPNPYEIQKVRFHAGDVAGPNLFINSTDAARIQQNFVFGTLFDRAPWTFWRAGFSIFHNPLVGEPEYTEYYPKVNLSVGSDATADMLGLVTGDFNRSFNPTLTKAASASLSLFYSGNITAAAGQPFDLHLRMAESVSIGAVSFVLSYPSALAEIQDVLVNSVNGQLLWSAESENELRIGWHSPVPMNLEAGETLITLKLKPTEAFTAGQTIALELAPDPLNELADGLYNVIGNAMVTVEMVNASTLGTGPLSAGQNGEFRCHPNPSDRFTMLSYDLPFDGHVTLKISSMAGNQVSLLTDEVQPAGHHLLRFDSEDLPAGIYLATLRLKSPVNEWIRTIKIIKNQNGL